MTDQPLPEVPFPTPSRRSLAPTVVSVYVMTLMLSALVFNALVIKNETITTTLVTAITLNFTNVISFWIGSSHSDQKKDVTISSFVNKTNP